MTYIYGGLLSILALIGFYTVGYSYPSFYVKISTFVVAHGVPIALIYHYRITKHDAEEKRK